MVHLQKAKVLFVDAYDSFSNNIVSLLESQLHVEVTKIHHDAHVPDLEALLEPYAAIVAGPGPGTALNPKDVGLIARLWTLADDHLIPVLGICLGFQSLTLSLGGSIERLPFPRHGISTTITTNGSSIFQGLPVLQAIQYHSLHASRGPESQSATRSKSSGWWSSEPANPDLVPLAWDFDRDWESQAGGQPSPNPVGILMGVKHAKRPFYGIQFLAVF